MVKYICGNLTARVRGIMIIIDKKARTHENYEDCNRTKKFVTNI